MDEKLKPCPFCGGRAQMKMVKPFVRWAACAVVISISHRQNCIIGDTEEIVFGNLSVDLESEHGKQLLEEIKVGFAKRWNRRAK